MALRTLPRRFLCIAANVTTRRILFFVQGERYAAMRTLHFFPAGLTGQHGEKSATVEKKNGLLALGQPRLDGHGELRGNELVVALAVLAAQTHVDDTKDRQHATIVPVGQLEQVVFPLLAIFETFQRRRGRAEQNGAGLHLAADHGEIACMITRTFILLVRGVVLLVDDDEAEIL